MDEKSLLSAQFLNEWEELIGPNEREMHTKPNFVKIKVTTELDTENELHITEISQENLIVNKLLFVVLNSIHVMVG